MLGIAKLCESYNLGISKKGWTEMKALGHFIPLTPKLAKTLTT
jgi:hypothetical protein